MIKPQIKNKVKIKNNMEHKMKNNIHLYKKMQMMYKIIIIEKIFFYKRKIRVIVTK